MTERRFTNLVNRALFLINSANVVIPVPNDFRAVRKCGRLRGKSHGYRESDTSQQRLHGPHPNFSFSRRRGLHLAQSNAPQKGTHIHPRNRKRFDGAVAVVRSVAVTLCALDSFSSPVAALCSLRCQNRVEGYVIAITSRRNFAANRRIKKD